MLADFKNYINTHNLFNRGEKILLAVSGGIDSMVMANLFLKAGYSTGIAHCNFSLRGEESDGDELFVKNFAELHKIPFHPVRFDTKRIAKNNGLSIQMAARELRYSWFEEVRDENSYDLIAVAHNLNDNIETLIINLTRGTGLAGLSGMKPLNNKVIRPILFATRQSIEQYADAEGISFREDRSNAETKYARNKIRHCVIPVLKEINPAIETTLNDTAERFYDLNEIVTESVSRLRDKLVDKKEKYRVLGISSLKPYIHNRSLMFELFRPYGITSVQVSELLKVIDGKTGGWIITDTHRIIKNRKELLISKEKGRKDEKLTIGSIKGFSGIPFIKTAEYVTIDNDFEIPSDTSTACIDTARLKYPLTIRKWKPGDYFYPLGMKQKKKLSDYFIDRKYSLIDKEHKLILESDGKIVWIIGDRLDNRFRISGHTRKVLYLKTASKPLVIKKL